MLSTTLYPGEVCAYFAIAVPSIFWATIESAEVRKSRLDGASLSSDREAEEGDLRTRTDFCAFRRRFAKLSIRQPYVTGISHVNIIDPLLSSLIACRSFFTFPPSRKGALCHVIRQRRNQQRFVDNHKRVSQCTTPQIEGTLTDGC